MIEWSEQESAALIYAAGHLDSSERYPDDPHAGDSRDLGYEVIEELIQAKIDKAIEKDRKERDGAICWDTTCLGCAGLLDKLYAAEAGLLEAKREAYGEGWTDRDNDCSESYSPPQVNPYASPLDEGHET